MSITKQKSDTGMVEGETLDDVLGTSSSVAITADDEHSKNTFLDRKEEDLAFIDKPGEAETKTDDKSDEDDADDKTKEKPEDIASVIDEIDSLLEKTDDDSDLSDDKNKAGRKPALVETIGKLVEKGVLELFEGEDDISKYTNDDLVELIESNIRNRVEETASNAPLEIFSRLDPKLQDVVAYNLKGGKDILKVLKSVTASQEISELSLDTAKDQERIVREYYRSVDWTEEDINDEVTSLIDREDLEKRATQFKPKLDAKQANLLQKKIEEQDSAKKRADLMQAKYAETIFKVLDNPTINGIPLTQRTQAHLYNAMINTGSYQDRNGNPTNTLGHLIEELQFGEKPNHPLLLEALWLMSNPLEYRQNIATMVRSENASNTYRQLKSAEGDKKASSSTLGEGKDNVKRTIKRATNKSFLSRD